MGRTEDVEHIVFPDVYACLILDSLDDYFSLPNKEAVDVLYEYDGLAGQNNQDPRSRFSNHGLVFWEGHIYDPSYGVKLGGAAFTREQALFLWSKHVIAGFCNTRVPVLQIQGEEHLRCRIYTKESLELVVEE